MPAQSVWEVCGEARAQRIREDQKKAEIPVNLCKHKELEGRGEQRVCEGSRVAIRFGQEWKWGATSEAFGGAGQIYLSPPTSLFSPLPSLSSSHFLSLFSFLTSDLSLDTGSNSTSQVRMA